MKKTNVIHFHAESWNGRMLGCQEFHPALAKATPNIDKLAAEGINFRNAYCTNPICCPSRANMLSGTYTHTCESWSNFKGLEQGMWTFDKGLRKTHDKLIVGKHDDHITGGHSVMNRVADFLEPLNTESYPVMNDDGAQAFSIDPGREERYHFNDWKSIDRVVEFIESKKESDKPFFVSINPGLVHASFRTNQYWLEKIPEELVDIPPVDDTNHPADVYQRKAKGWRHGLDDETVKTVRRIYFAMCAEADAMLGEVMNALKEAGLEDETTVIFSSDHGELALEHQQYYKMSLLEGSARVPLIMKGPGIKPGQLIETPVSLIDIAPTICELGGLEQRKCFEGESLMPMARGETTDCRGWALASYSGVTSNTFTWMIRKDDYKLIVNEGYKSRLYNINEDPGELNDLIDKESERAAELLGILDNEVDRKTTLKIWEDYRKHNYAQFQRQAKKGLYHDNSYSLRANPSSEYEKIIDNALTGWTPEDEKRVAAWLDE